MKYFSIILTVMVTALIGRATEPQTNWFYDQSTLQAFYIFDTITIDGLVVEGDGCGEDCSDGSYNECYTEGGCDVIGAFRRGVCSNPNSQSSQALCVALGDTWNTDEEICIGWVYANSEGGTTVPLMGREGDVGDNTYTYANGDEVAYLKVYDSSNGSILDLAPSAELPGWVNLEITTITGTSTACNGGDELDDCGICSGSFGGHEANSDKDCTGDCFGSTEIDCFGVCDGSAALDDCDVCEGENADMDCAGDCFGSSVDTWCDGVCGETGPIDDLCDVCDGDNSSCTGCTNTDSDDYVFGNTIPCNNGTENDCCTYTVPGATDLYTTDGPNRVILNWTAPVDDFTVSTASYSYNVYMDGVYNKTTGQVQTQVTGLDPGTYCFYVVAVHGDYGLSDDISTTLSPGSDCGNATEVTGPTWRLQLVATIDSYDQFQFSGYTADEWLLTDHENYLGAASDASWGYDSDHDTPEPPNGPGNFIKLFFDHPEWNEWATHYTEDIVMDDDAFFSTNLTVWNGRIESDVPGSTTITLHVQSAEELGSATAGVPSKL